MKDGSEVPIHYRMKIAKELEKCFKKMEEIYHAPIEASYFDQMTRAAKQTGAEKEEIDVYQGVANCFRKKNPFSLEEYECVWKSRLLKYGGMPQRLDMMRILIFSICQEFEYQYTKINHEYSLNQEEKRKLRDFFTYLTNPISNPELFGEGLKNKEMTYENALEIIQNYFVFAKEYGLQIIFWFQEGLQFDKKKDFLFTDEKWNVGFSEASIS